MLVNARLSFIAVDVWYRRLPNNTAVMTIDTNISLRLMPANRFRLTIVKKRQNKTVNETYIYTILTMGL